ncbi:MAG: Do family serine endopeptidase [Bacteroidetes bacterium]|nr:Do family serine endopeptidase [Bacteroidota bacterium]
MNRYIGFIVVGIASALIALAVFSKFNQPEQKVIIRESQPVQWTQVNKNAAVASSGFVEAAAVSTPAVVHIKTAAAVKTSKRMDPFWEFFGDEFGLEEHPRQGSGSGVILSSDGYIVTNNHVVDGADEIMVTLHDMKEFEAELIGTDPTTDLAVLKIKNDNLEYLSFANSDEVQVGEWVLAVGNPFNLASTVTAGIISAKARNINIIREKAGNIAIESFLQTDAAVNPGNSGGALVDLKGNLIGVNTAIASSTGAYAGYSFAIPSNLVKKVVKDIMDYGIVQRGFMGVSISNLTAEQAEEMGIEDVQGVYISEIVQGSGADDAGLQPGDVITQINGNRIKSSPELQETVGRFRPGDAIGVEIIRDNKTISKDVVLKTRDNSTDIISKKEAEKESGALAKLGGVFENLTPEEARAIGVRGGVKVKKIKDGVLADNTQMQPGFVITKANNKPVYSMEELEEILSVYTGDGVLIEGRYPNMNGTKYYAFGM